jgi:hypothetical protein
MYPKIKQIILTWRQGKSHRRIPIGVVKSNSSEGMSFRYLLDGVNMAKEAGFICFPEFPDTSKKYTLNVDKILSRRINNPDRADIQKYYDFWEVPDSAKTDVFKMLAYTEGQLPTDNFEFLAQYYSVTGVKFVSEVAGFHYNKIDTGILQEGDKLEWRFEKDNKQDSKAVSLYYNGYKIGYVKLIHNDIFTKKNSHILNVVVKKLEQNGHVSKAYILIYASR